MTSKNQYDEWGDPVVTPADLVEPDLSLIHDYHRDATYASKSALDILNRSPYEYYLKKVLPELIANGKERDPVPFHVRQEWAKEGQKRHFVIGDALDRLLLEPHKFQADFYVGTAHSLNTKEGKAEAQHLAMQNPNKRWLSPDEMRDIKGMRDAIMRSPFAGFVNPATSQHTYKWVDHATGIKCKCRPDWTVELDILEPQPWQPDTRLRLADGRLVEEIIFDLKSIDNIGKWAKHVADFRYDVQNAFYLDGVNAYHDDGKARAFAFMIVEVEWPHRVMVRTLPDEAVQIGRLKYRQDLAVLSECRASGVWPDGGNTWELTQMPPWYYSQAFKHNS